MDKLEEARILRIYLGESDRWEKQPLYEVLVTQAHQKGLAGATVLRGLMGFGAHSRIHTNKVLNLSMDLPMIVEIVDSKEKLEAFILSLAPMLDEHLVTLESIQILR